MILNPTTEIVFKCYEIKHPHFGNKHKVFHLIQNFSQSIFYLNMQHLFPGLQKMSERANKVRGKFWLIGGNFNQQFKN